MTIENPRKVIRLTLLHEDAGSTLRVIDASNEGSSMATLNIAIAGAQRSRLYSLLTAAIETGNADALRDAGQQAFQSLFPTQTDGRAPLVEWLVDSNSGSDRPILLEMTFDDTDWAIFPFELLHDGERWWWQRFIIGRRFDFEGSSARFQLKAISADVPASVSMVMAGRTDGANELTESLKQELTLLDEHLADSPFLTKSHRAVDFDDDPEEALAAFALDNSSAQPLLFSCDVFHFSGHADAAGWRLSPDRSFSVEDLERLAQRSQTRHLPALIFVNACHGLDGDNGIAMLKALRNLGGRFLITTLSKVRSSDAVAMADAFYGYLAKGVAPMDALYKARADLFRKNGIAWAPYIMFGPVDAHIFPNLTPLPDRAIEGQYTTGLAAFCEEKSKFYTELRVLPPGLAEMKVRSENEPEAKSSKMLTEVVADWLTKDGNRLMTLDGQAGAGKSHALRVIARYICTNEPPFINIPLAPVLIELNLIRSRDFAGVDFVEQLAKLALNSVRTYIDAETWLRFFRTRLEEGKLLFLLDSINEIDEIARQEFEKEFTELFKTYPRNRFLITSRPSDLLYNRLAKFFQPEQYSLQPLNRDEIRVFLDTYFHELKLEDYKADKVIEEMNVRLLTIVNVPLMLYLLVKIVVEWKNIQVSTLKTEYDLFDYFFMGRWEHERLKYREQTTPDPSKEAVLKHGEAFCREMALLMRRRGRVSCAQDTLNAWIVEESFNSSYISALLDMIPGGDLESSSEVLKVLVDMNLLDKSNRELRFWHESFQEYYAARELLFRLDRACYEPARFGDEIVTNVANQLMFRPLRMLLVKILQDRKLEGRQSGLVAHLSRMGNHDVDRLLSDVCIVLGKDFFETMSSVLDGLLEGSATAEDQDSRIDLFLNALIVAFREQETEMELAGVSDKSIRASGLMVAPLVGTAITAGSLSQERRRLVKNYLYLIHAHLHDMCQLILQQLYEPISWRAVVRAGFKKLIHLDNQEDRAVLNLLTFLLTFTWQIVTVDFHDRNKISGTLELLQNLLKRLNHPVIRALGAVGPSLTKLLTVFSVNKMALDNFVEYHSCPVKEFLPLALDEPIKHRFNTILEYMNPYKPDLDLNLLRDSLNAPCMLSQLGAVLVYPAHLLSGDELYLADRIPDFFSSLNLLGKQWFLVSFCFTFKLDAFNLTKESREKIDAQIRSLASYWLEDPVGSDEFLSNRAEEMPTNDMTKPGTFTKAFQYYLLPSLLAERRQGIPLDKFGEYYIKQLVRLGGDSIQRFLECLVIFAYYAPYETLAMLRRVLMEKLIDFNDETQRNCLATIIAIVKLREPSAALKFTFKYIDYKNFDFDVSANHPVQKMTAYLDTLNLVSLGLFSLLKYPVCREFMLELARAAGQAKKTNALFSAFAHSLTTRLFAFKFNILDNFLREEDGAGSVALPIPKPDSSKKLT